MQPIRIFAVPYDCGVRGTRMGAGPQGLLDGGLERHLRAAGHAVETRWIEAPEPPHGLGAETQLAFGIVARLATDVAAARGAGAFPLVLGGPCYSAIGMASGLGPSRTGVIWFDAHGDFNTPDTTPSGHMDGMGLAVLTGRGWQGLAATVPGFEPLPDRQLLWLGVRDLDPLERRLMESSEASWLTPGELPGGLDPALERLREQVDRLYVHIDPDVLDESEGTANFLSGPGGLALDDMLAMLRRIAERFSIAGVTFASYQPELDRDGRIREAGFRMFDALLD